MRRHTPDPMRRHLLQAGALTAVLPALGSLGGCASTHTLAPITEAGTTDPAATALLNESAAAHGLAGWRRIRDLNISYTGQWRALIGTLQPELTDTRFRGTSQERLLPGERLSAQAHTGPGGQKQVLRHHGQGSDQGRVQVWYNGAATSDETLSRASALVADGYRLFLLGPLVLVDQGLTMKLAGLEQVGDAACERLMVRLSPGLGLSGADQLVLCIDRRTRLVRRLRFTLDGLASTRGAVAEVDTYDFQNIHGVEWPTRFHERLRKPIPLLPVHDWQLTGLDINRGWTAQDVGGPQFAGAARAPAKALPGSP